MDDFYAKIIQCKESKIKRILFGGQKQYSVTLYTVSLKRRHVALAKFVHHLTRSKHFITILNKLGHGISYKTLKDLDTEIIRAIISEDENKKVIVPKNIVRNPSL